MGVSPLTFLACCGAVGAAVGVVIADVRYRRDRRRAVTISGRCTHQQL